MMRYCSHCGTQVHEQAAFCSSCGSRLNGPAPASRHVEEDDILGIVIKVFMILGCISSGWLLIPLAWSVPMTVSVFRKLDGKQPIGTGLKICSLLFVNLVAGVCMLCRQDP